MEQYEAEQLLPKVGAKLKRVSTIVCPRGLGWPPVAEECEVIEVNRPHLWFRVRFTRTGSTECYKVPRLTDYKGGFIE